MAFADAKASFLGFAGMGYSAHPDRRVYLSIIQYIFVFVNTLSYFTGEFEKFFTVVFAKIRIKGLVYLFMVLVQLSDV